MLMEAGDAGRARSLRTWGPRMGCNDHYLLSGFLPAVLSEPDSLPGHPLDGAPRYFLN